MKRWSGRPLAAAFALICFAASPVRAERILPEWLACRFALCFWTGCLRCLLVFEERELALYMLTSPHGNSLGCFRLPMAYLCDDLGRDIKTVRKTLSKLFEIGFLERDEDSGWTWIVGFLDHNPIPNRGL